MKRQGIKNTNGKYDYAWVEPQLIGDDVTVLIFATNGLYGETEAAALPIANAKKLRDDLDALIREIEGQS